MNFDIATIQAYVTLLKDFISGLAAFIATVIAVIGLQAWKKQLKGKTEYELAQRYLRAVYRVREALIEARSPFQSDEISQALSEANPKEIHQEIRKTSSMRKKLYMFGYTRVCQKAVYQKRWQRISTEFLDLETILLEAEVHWGRSVKQHFNLLQKHASSLLTAINAEIESIENNDKVQFVEDVENRRKIILAVTDGSTEDPFANELKDTIRNIEAFIKPRLRI